MTIFESVRQLIGQGEVEQALRLLITHLETEKNNPEALRTLRVVEANYSAARKKELRGLLDTDEIAKAYSVANDALISINEDLAAGRKPVVELETVSKQGTRIYWFTGVLLGFGILFVLSFIAGILSRDKKNTTLSVPPPPVLSECPTFDTSAITVMLIPFLDLGDTKSNPALALQTRIRDLTQRNNVKSDVKIFQGEKFVKDLPDNAAAAAVGRQCAAKMVIWGQYEKVDEGISIDVRYVFTDQHHLPAGAIADTFRNLSELKGNSRKFTSLEDAVFSLCTFMALHEGRVDLAEKWLDKMKTSSPRDQQIKRMLKSK